MLSEISVIVKEGDVISFFIEKCIEKLEQNDLLIPKLFGFSIFHENQPI